MYEVIGNFPGSQMFSSSGIFHCLLKLRLHYSVFPVARFDEHSDFLSLLGMREKSKTLGSFSFTAIALFSKVNKLLW